MRYIPKQGDIIYMDFNPQAGHEQRGRRPALVVSNYYFNEITGLATVCPITNTRRGFPLHVKLPSAMITSGYVMCEQIKSLDLHVRNADYREKAENELLEEVLDIIEGIFEVE